VLLQVLPLAPKEPYARGIEALNMAHRTERATRKMGDAHETTS